jgi:hypothetical protein
MPGSGTVRIRLRPEDRARIAAARQRAAGAQAGGAKAKKLRTADQMLQAAITMTARFHRARDRARRADAAVRLPSSDAGIHETGADGASDDEEEAGSQAVAQGSSMRTAPGRAGQQHQERDRRRWAGGKGARGAEEGRGSDVQDGMDGESLEPDEDRAVAEQGARSGLRGAGGSSRDAEGGDVEEAAAGRSKLRRPGSREGRMEETEEEGEGEEEGDEPRSMSKGSVGGGSSVADGAKAGGRRGRGGGASGKLKFFRSRGEAAGESGEGNKTAALRPALQGYNLTWGALEDFEREQEADMQAAAEAFRQRRRERRRQQGGGGAEERAPVVTLTAGLARGCAREEMVILTWASGAFLDFLATWVHRLLLQEADNFLVGARRACPTYYYDSK